MHNSVTLMVDPFERQAAVLDWLKILVTVDELAHFAYTVKIEQQRVWLDPFNGT